MAIFVCDVCDCIENSTEGNWWFRGEDDYVAKYSSCYKGQWHKYFPRQRWDQKRRVENRPIVDGPYPEYLYEKDSWMGEAVELKYPVLESERNIYLQRDGFYLFFHLPSGIGYEKTIGYVSVIRSKELLSKIQSDKLHNPRKYARIRLDILVALKIADGMFGEDFDRSCVVAGGLFEAIEEEILELESLLSSGLTLAEKAYSNQV